jgi:uncharacterized membrane protein YdjX (TVP38/TMEM64 family)
MTDIRPVYSRVEVYGSLESGHNRNRRRSLSEVSTTSSQATESVWAERLKVVGVLLLMCFAVALGIKGIEDDWFDSFEAFATAHQVTASIAIVLLFIPMSLMFVPIDGPLYLVAGFMYGFLPGALLTWIGYNLGSWVGFVVGRHVFRRWFIRRTQGNKFVQAIRLAVRDNAFVLVVLLQVRCLFFNS